MQQKTQELRLAECVNIRKQLTQLGAFLSELNKKKVKDSMNGFVKEGKSATFRLSLTPDTCVKVMLSNEKQSGMELVKL